MLNLQPHDPKSSPSFAPPEPFDDPGPRSQQGCGPVRLSRPNLRASVRLEAVAVLLSCPKGLRFTKLIQQMQRLFPDRKAKSLSNDLVNLDRHAPNQVFKPSRGVYMHYRFADQAVSAESVRIENRSNSAATVSTKVPEGKFYPKFAAWLKDDLEEVTMAIPLGGNWFRDRWGTPDILGKAESRRSDVIKGPTSIVAGEVKVDTTSLLVGFGQACAHKLFAHKSYLAVPQQASGDELERLVALCQMHGIGLVIFDNTNIAKPAFRLLVRPVAHQPDLYYTNRYIRRVESKLFT